MRIIDANMYENLDTSKYVYIDKVYFMYPHEIDKVLEACKHDANKLREWFDTIQINYDSLEIIENNYIVYYINGEKLSLQNLSSGEQTLLYMLAYKELNEPILVWALLERIGKRLADIIVKQFKNYDLTIVMIGECIQECMLPYYDRG